MTLERHHNKQARLPRDKQAVPPRDKGTTGVPPVDEKDKGSRGRRGPPPTKPRVARASR